MGPNTCIAISVTGLYRTYWEAKRAIVCAVRFYLFGSNSAGSVCLEKQLRMRDLTVWTIKNGYSTCLNGSLNILLKNEITLSTGNIFLSLLEGQLPALENVSQHILTAALKANIRMSEQGLGLIIIQNGPYLQITSLVEKSSAANNGKLKPGDVPTKIGHTNILGWTLRDLRQLLHNIPVGTPLEIGVCRDFAEVPQHWQSAVELIPEVKLPVMTADSSEDAEDEDNARSSSDGDVGLETFQYKSSQSYYCEFTQKLPSVSDTGQTLRVGTDNGYDAVRHNDVDALCNPKFDASGVRPPSYWAMENNKTSSSSSCPSASDTSYLEEFTLVSE